MRDQPSRPPPSVHIVLRPYASIAPRGCHEATVDGRHGRTDWRWPLTERTSAGVLQGPSTQLAACGLTFRTCSARSYAAPSRIRL